MRVHRDGEDHAARDAGVMVRPKNPEIRRA